MITVRQSSNEILLEMNCSQVMLAEGAKIEATTSTGWTPLFYAVCTQNVEVVRVSYELYEAPQGQESLQALLVGGANIEALDTRRNTPLYYAVRSQNVELVKVRGELREIPVIASSTGSARRRCEDRCY